MEIKSVELVYIEARQGGFEKSENGGKIAIVPQEESYSFTVKLKDDTQMTVPNEPLNRHYREVADWYASQKKKPFKFDFE